MAEKRQVELYEYDELDGVARGHVEEQWMQVVIDMLDELDEHDGGTDGLRRAVEEAERLRCPWFLPGFIWRFWRDGMLELCRSRLYTKSGFCGEEK